MPNKNDLDIKTVTIAAQAIVGAKIEKKFDLTSEDIESAVMMLHTMLAADQDQYGARSGRGWGQCTLFLRVSLGLLRFYRSHRNHSMKYVTVASGLIGS